MSEQIVSAWLDAVKQTIRQHDLTAHMDLISKQVSLTGVPGFEQIGYDDWYQQCQQEFAEQLVAGINYEGLVIRAATASRVMFQTYETIITSSGERHAQGIEALLELETDGKWRLLQQRILSNDEARHTGLID